MYYSIKTKIQIPKIKHIYNLLPVKIFLCVWT